MGRGKRGAGEERGRKRRIERERGDEGEEEGK